MKECNGGTLDAINSEGTSVDVMKVHLGQFDHITVPVYGYYVNDIWCLKFGVKLFL